MLTLVLVGVPACSQSYNGAWSFGQGAEPVKLSAGVDAGASAPKTAATTTAPAIASTTPNHTASPSAPAAAPASRVSFTPGTPADADASPQASARPAFAGLALFGQLPQNARRSSSAMDGSDNIRRVSFTTEGADFDPEVDPTGGTLVYASTRHRTTSDIYLARIGGTAVTQITNDPANDVMPTFSPDGRRIAFASDRSGNWDIYIMDAAGGQAVQLTSDPTHDIHPSFSPDGKSLVYCSYGAQSGQWELVVIDIEKPATKQFIGYGLFPRWSPVDSRIVFQRARERGTRWFSIWTVEFTDGQAMRPTEVAASSNAAAITPAWSPDGRQIVFCTIVNPDGTSHASPGNVNSDQPRQADLWMINADGSGRVNLTNSRFANLQPVWARDGSIYFVSDRGKDGVQNVWALSAQRAVMMAQSPTGRATSAAAKAQPQAPAKTQPTATAAAQPSPAGPATATPIEPSTPGTASVLVPTPNE